MLFGLQMETLWNIIIKVFDFILDFKITLILDQFKKEYHILYFHIRTLFQTKVKKRGVSHSSYLRNFFILSISKFIS